MNAEPTALADTRAHRRRHVLSMPAPVYDALVRCAAGELRDPKRQAVDLLAAELVHRGYLADGWNDRRQDVSDATAAGASQ
jgi:hypothetical protein